jgi:hypothetical protein
MDRIDWWVRSNENALRCVPTQIRVKYEKGMFKIAALTSGDPKQRREWSVKAVGTGRTLADAIENLCDAVGAPH